MTRTYSDVIGKGQVRLPHDDTERENLLDTLQDHDPENDDLEPALGGKFVVEEIYVSEWNDKPHIDITGNIDGLFVSLEIPIRPTDGLQTLVNDIVKHASVDVSTTLSQSGLFLDLEDITEKVSKTADGQGRVNLGIDKAGKDVDIIVINTDPE